MDKNTLTGLILIGAIIIGFSFFGETAPVEENTKQNVVIEQADAQGQASPIEEDEDDYLNKDSQISETGLTCIEQPVRDILLENSKISVTLSSLGAKAKEVRLLGFKNQEGGDVTLFHPTDVHFNLPIRSLKNTFIETECYNFTVVEHTASSVTFRMLFAEADAYLDLVYELLQDDYRLSLRLAGKNLDKVLPINTTQQTLEWSVKTIQQEQSHRFEGQYSGIYYYTASGDDDDLTTTDQDSERVSESLRWVAFKDKYFSSVLINNSSAFEDSNLEILAMPDSSGYVRDCRLNTSFAFDVRRNAHASFSFFFGPNDYDLLTSYDEGLSAERQLRLDYLVYLGANIFRLVNKWIIIPVISFLKMFISNWGIIILLLTLIIKSALFPFTFKSYLSQAKMRVLKPQIDEINAKYEGKTDQETMLKKQKETMNLYSSAGVSPLGGCLPMLLQAPFMIALYMYFPTSIFLRGESFLWAKDLSTYDPVISWDFNIPLISSMLDNHISLFCLLMTIVNILYMKYISSQNSTAPTGDVMTVMKYMPYMMSVMFFFMFNSNASGLSYYYFVSILITIIQYLASRYFIDEEKLLIQLEENKKKPKKKSKWMERMEEAQRQQKEMQRRKQKGH